MKLTKQQKEDLVEGLRQSANGEVVDLGSFEEWANGDVEESDDA